jgi:histidinol-phosphate aminotransferase
MLAQIGAAAAMRDIDYRNKTREMIIATRNKTAGQLRESDYKLTESQANFMFVGTKDAKALYEYLFAHKILVRYWDKPRISNHLRITIGTDEKMEEFIQCVKQF